MAFKNKKLVDAEYLKKKKENEEKNEEVELKRINEIEEKERHEKEKEEQRKEAIEKEIKTVDTEQSKILKFENDFLGNFNKMNETLDKGFNSQVSSADLNNKNIEKDGEIKTQILSANVKLSDDFTKGKRYYKRKQKAA